MGCRHAYFNNEAFVCRGFACRHPLPPPAVPETLAIARLSVTRRPDTPRPGGGTQSNPESPENSVPRFYNLPHLQTHPRYQSVGALGSPEGGSRRHVSISFPSVRGARAQPEPPAGLPQGLGTCSDGCPERQSSSVRGWALPSVLVPSSAWSPVVPPAWHLPLFAISVFICLRVESQSPRLQRELRAGQRPSQSGPCLRPSPDRRKSSMIILAA